MKFLVVLCMMAVAIQLALAAPSAEKLDCANFDDALDELGQAQGYTSISEKYKLPTNAEDHKKRCTEMVDAIKMLRRYNKECVTSLTQQVFSAMLKTRAAMQEKYCTPGTPEEKDSLDASKCAVEQALDAVKAAEKKIVLTAQVILDANLEEKVRLRRACCNVEESRNTFLAATKDKCGAYSKLYSLYVESYTAEAMSLICPASDTLKCNELEAIKWEGVEMKSKFFLKPMFKLIKSLDHPAA